MNLLIDIGHPAHVHYYKNLAWELEKRNHRVYWTVKNIPVAKRLLELYGFNYIELPKKGVNIFQKVIKQIQYDYVLLNICKKLNIDTAIGTSVSVAHVSKLSKVKSYVFDDDDDDVQPFITLFVNPFADVLVSPSSLMGKRKRKDTIYYPGFHELAYLHPNRFKPDTSVLKELGLTQNDRFFIMRFNSFKAHHDVGISGLTIEQKLKLIDLLKPHGKIFITTERNIELELKEYQLTISPDKIHSLMSFATIFIGDSQTMTSEAAVLGVPSLRCNSFSGRISYLEEEEHRYGLTYGFTPNNFDKMVVKLNEILKNTEIKAIWQSKREKLLSEKIDVTAFWVWLLENKIYKLHETPDSDFWNIFK